MLLTSIEALELRQDQRGSFLQRDRRRRFSAAIDALYRNRSWFRSQLARPTSGQAARRTSGDESEGFGAGGCGRIGIGAPHREAITEVARRASRGYVDAGCPFGLTTSQVPPNPVTLWHSTWVFALVGVEVQRMPRVGDLSRTVAAADRAK